MRSKLVPEFAFAQVPDPPKVTDVLVGVFLLPIMVVVPVPVILRDSNTTDADEASFACNEALFVNTPSTVLDGAVVQPLLNEVDVLVLTVPACAFPEMYIARRDRANNLIALVV